MIEMSTELKALSLYEPKLFEMNENPLHSIVAPFHVGIQKLLFKSNLS